MDIGFFIPAETFRALSATQRAYFDSFRRTSHYQQYRIDNYGVAHDTTSPVGQWNYAYWLRQFGYSRADKMKGILQVPVPFVVAP